MCIRDRAVTDRELITVAGMPSVDVVAVLADAKVPFSEVSAHRASLEEAYMELTRDAVEFRAPSSQAPSNQAPSTQESAW